MKKPLILTLSLMLTLASVFCFSGRAMAADFNDVPYETVTLAKTSPDYYKAAYDAEFINFKLVRSLPTIFTEDSWKAYTTACARLPYIDAENIDDAAKGHIDAAVEARGKLVQTKSFADGAWFIWGDAMPCAEDESKLEFTYESWDYPGFKPFLVPYVLEDQSAVRGNLIVIAGGYYSQRSNTGEGYPIAKRFNELGYNAFVLQRRVAPFSPEDSFMDLQRSIRYLRSYAKDKGLGGIDCIMAAGFSGGGGTVSGTVCNCYGDVQPAIYDKAYKPDAVDAVNSDLDVAMVIYGPAYDLGNLDGGKFAGWVTKNENLPAVFIAAGAADNIVPADFSLILYQQLADKTLAELHIFGNTHHGFGVGKEGTNATFWIPMADNFVEIFKTQRAKAAEGK